MLKVEKITQVAAQSIKLPDIHFLDQTCLGIPHQRGPERTLAERNRAAYAIVGVDLVKLGSVRLADLYHFAALPLDGLLLALLIRADAEISDPHLHSRPPSTGVGGSHSTMSVTRSRMSSCRNRAITSARSRLHR